MTLKNKGAANSIGYHQIIKLGKSLGMPSEFLRKGSEEMSQFLLTRDFIAMLKVHMHSLLNNVIFEQFNLNSKNEEIPVPKLLSTL